MFAKQSVLKLKEFTENNEFSAQVSAFKDVNTFKWQKAMFWQI